MSIELTTGGYGSPRWTGEILDCSMPMTFDTYSNCAFNCAYCFSSFQALAEEKIPHEYRLHGTAFTSGIVNENNPLKYHYDAGNFRGVWSGMIVFKSGIEGGHLALPEFGLGVELCDRSLFLFDGQGILHGVTPIVRTRPDAKRYSIVYYSLQNMWSCRPLGEELDRIRQKRTEREAKRAAKQVRSDTPG